MEYADNVVLVSDHGSGPLKHFTNVVPSLLEVDAFRLRRNPWRRLSGPVNRMVQALPSPYRARGQRLLPPKLRDAIQVRLRPMHWWLASAPEQFRIRVDWSSAVLPLNQGLIYLNPHPRPSAASPSEILEVLEGLPGVVKVWSKEESYTGPLLSTAPDLWIETEPGVEIVARFDDSWETKPPERGIEWIVNHRANGIFGFWGKDVEGGGVEQASIYDMCPTLLSFFGIRSPSAVDGKALPVFRGVNTGHRELPRSRGRT